MTNSTNQAVTWQVNGITGGSTATGTITSAGLYTAPATMPALNAVSIGAISAVSSSASAIVSEAIWNPVPVLTSATATQTVVGQTSTFLIDVKGTGFVSGATITFGGTALTTSFISATELQANYSTSTTVTSAIGVTNPNPGSAGSATANVQFPVTLATLATASRLLDQATFGQPRAILRTCNRSAWTLI